MVAVALYILSDKCSLVPGPPPSHKEKWDAWVGHETNQALKVSFIRALWDCIKDLNIRPAAWPMAAHVLRNLICRRHSYDVPYMCNWKENFESITESWCVVTSGKELIAM